MRLVLDTNTVLALWMFSDPALEPLRQACTDKAVLLAAEATLEELARVLAYPQFGLSPEKASEIFSSYREKVEMVRQKPAHAWPLPVCKDRDDQKFLELARDGKAGFLVTRDKALLKLARRKVLHGRFAILTPEKFTSLL